MTGKWSDFATGESGFDLIDLYAAMRHSGERVPAAKELGAMLGIPAINGHAHEPIPVKTTEGWYPIVPPPLDAPKPAPQQLQCDKLYEYYDQNDRLLFYVRRREARDGKQFYPLVYGTKNGVTGLARQTSRATQASVWAEPTPALCLRRQSSCAKARRRAMPRRQHSRIMRACRGVADASRWTTPI